MTSPAPSKPGASGTETLEPITTPRTGWLVGMDGEGRLLVDFEGNRVGPCVARRTVPLEREALQSAVDRRQSVMLLFENGDPRLPVIIGLIQVESATPLLDAVLASPSPEAHPEPEAAPEQPVEAHVDGKRVVIEGADEVVLQCGQASITLRRNGKVIIKGSYVETHSTGVNRIKGGSVQVN